MKKLEAIQSAFNGADQKIDFTVPQFTDEPQVFGDVELGDSQTFEIIETRAYQLDAWAAIDEARNNGKDKALLHMATGLGKTTVAAVDALRYMREHPQANGLFLAPQNEIVDQAEERFAECFEGTFSTGKLRGNYESKPKPDFLFATLQTMKDKKSLFDPTEFDYIVVDESHHGKADTFEKTIDYFDPDFLLGITATPDRSDLKQIREIFGDEVYSKSLSEALAERLLAKVDYRVLMDETVATAVKNKFRSVEELNRSLFVPKRNEEIVDIIKLHAQEIEQPKTIVFCKNLDAAQELAEQLPQALILTSEVPPAKRKRILEQYRAGEADTILTVNMFNEGVDIPDANLLVFLRSTESSTVFQQQLGRGLRLSPGKESVRVLDFVANSERLRSINELKKQIEYHSSELEESGQPGNDVSVVFDLQNNTFDFEELVQDMDGILSKLEKVALNMSNEQIVGLAHSLSPDMPLRTTLIKKLSGDGKFPSTTTIKERFGSMAAFHEACGFEPTRVSPDISNEELVALALELGSGKRISEKDIEEWSSNGDFLSPGTVSSRFGTLSKFYEACGLGGRRRNLTNDGIVDMALALNNDAPLKYDQVTKLSKLGKFPSNQTILERFGSMRAFHEACGFQVPDIISLGNDELIALAKQISPEEPLGQQRMNELSKSGDFISSRTIRRKFGSLTDFHKQCGFDSRVSIQQTPDENISQAVAVMQENPDVDFESLSFAKLSRLGKMASMATIIKNFGSTTEFKRQYIAEWERQGIAKIADQASMRLGCDAVKRTISGESDDYLTIINPEIVELNQDDVQQIWQRPPSKIKKLSKIDRADRSEKNHITGQRGESVVLEVERRRLMEAGRSDLAEKVWQASTVDDSLGFDILSYEADGRKKYIEVKATTQPRSSKMKFFVSENERRASEFFDNYHLYFVDDVESISPRVTTIKCPLDDSKFAVSAMSYVIQGIRPD